MNVTLPLISVIVPIYGVENYIYKCINSIISQTYKNLEIILIDDGSPDKCGQICDSYALRDQRIKVIHKENGGLSDARNAGLDIANGNYVVCVDSDDFVSVFFIENLYTAIKITGAEISSSWFVDYYDDDKEPQYSVVTQDKITVLSKEKYLEKMLYQDGVDICAWGKLYKRELFQGVRYPKGKLYEDILTTYLLVEKANNIAVIPNVDYCYYQRKNSIAQSSFSTEKLDAISHMRALRQYLTCQYPNLKKAASCRYFCTCCNILFLIPKGKYLNETLYIWNELKKLRIEVINDKNGRKKARVAALSSFLGLRLMRRLYNLRQR